MKKKEYFKKLIRTKAYLLSYGIRENKYSQEFYQQQNPYDIIKSGYVGLHFLLEGLIPTLASTTFYFDRDSKYELIKIKNKFYLKGDDGSQTLAIPIPMPKWYQKKTASGKPMASVFAHESTHYLHQQYSGCGYQIVGKGCKFCGVGCQWLKNTADEVAETAIEACKENNQYHICLGGGTRVSPDKGTDFFVAEIQKIRKKNKIAPIWVEMVPPDSNDDIEKMIQAGATAFGFNLEIWNDKRRQSICPGKCEVTKNRYFKAWKYVQKRLGKDHVNTALIVGLEPYNSTKEGINKISQAGVRITLLPFKPWDTSEYAQKEPAHPEKLLKLAWILARDMIKYDIKASKNYGCASCDSCTIEDDIMQYLLKSKI